MVTIIIAILLIIIICGALFFTQINNAMRSATGKDTPADTVVKNELVKKIEASKTGNAQTDAAIDKAATTLKQTKMSTIMKPLRIKTRPARSLIKRRILQQHSLRLPQQLSSITRPIQNCAQPLPMATGWLPIINIKHSRQTAISAPLKVN
ncbi:hypothetical protein [Secundilactobacillus paracollinoides]|uniref:hypothetical protein n=1 Tax=Secundilactobacillus paracollinoides TaxID=240427 RepID=UPI0012E1B444|nr:hypothetical protein [Secundilactobacillus paracollinoides]